ncbi:hypothetical protein IWX90DRAFT_392786 [Phyllosticta citrichinensis]|uniref:BAG domain-containing protein n=1 Tax=Phyllosticta citrichinensis TaxID=1130410 RepID=A0ABR1XGG2_9PEZI
MPALGEVDESPDPAPVRPVSTPKASEAVGKRTPATEARTPTNKSPIAPSHVEMHPQFHHHTTAKPLQEARWLGFMNMGPQTEPSKKGLSKIPITQATPTKSQELSRTFSPPDFKFTFRNPELDLSPKAKKMMEESRKDVERIRAQMAANPQQYGLQTNEELRRKIVQPKGKSTRFSDAHAKAFAKMESIANHPSAFRNDPSRLKPSAAAGSLKRSPSKAELDKVEKTTPKMSRSRSNVSLQNSDGKESAGPAKRVKRSKDDDASAARPAPRNGNDKGLESKSTVAPRTGIPRLNNLTTPTKASLARSQSVKTLKKTALITDVPKSPSVQHFTTPSKAKSTLLEGIRKVGQSVSRLPTVKSILRSPLRQYSDDPAKIAAGTHRPQLSDLNKKLPAVPATEPVQKRVNFSDSTLARTSDEEPATPTAASARATSDDVSSDVVYPDLSHTSPFRRATGDFTFRAETALKFGPSKPTIRHVRPSDTNAGVGGASTLKDDQAAKKRKVDGAGKLPESDKENEEEERPAKRSKPNTTPAAKSKTPSRSNAARPTGLPTTSSSLDQLVTAVAARYSQDPASFVAVLVATLLAGLLVGVFSFRRMSWSNRFGSWSGRFSPFGRGDSSNKEVSDADFSYITNEDLAASQNNHAALSGAPGRDNANGDTDVVVFKHKRVSYPVHFPRGSIDDDSLSIRGMREAAARKMGVDDPRRIKLFYKGRQLEDDRAAVFYGLRSDLESEVMCVVGEKPSSSRNSNMHAKATTTEARSSNSYSDDEASSDDYRSSTPAGDEQAQNKRSKKRNRRGGRKHKGARATSEVPQPTTTTPTNPRAGTYMGGAASSEFLGVPASTALPPRPTSSSSGRRPSPSSSTANKPTAVANASPMDKLETLSHKYHGELLPGCQEFLARPPADAAKRDFEHKRLTETILAQVLLKLDAVDTSGDEGARARRKELVRECNAMLNRLDAVVKPVAA